MTPILDSSILLVGRADDRSDQCSLYEHSCMTLSTGLTHFIITALAMNKYLYFPSQQTTILRNRNWVTNDPFHVKL